MLFERVKSHEIPADADFAPALAASRSEFAAVELLTGQFTSVLRLESNRSAKGIDMRIVHDGTNVGFAVKNGRTEEVFDIDRCRQRRYVSQREC